MRGNGMGVAAANRFGGENPEPVFGKSSEGGIYAGLPFCGRFRRQFAVLVEKPTTTPHDARHHAGSALDPRRVRPATIPPISCRRLSLIIRQEPAMTCRLTCHRNFEACRSLNGGFTASKLECDLARLGQFRSFECSKARWAGRRVTDRKPAAQFSPMHFRASA